MGVEEEQDPREVRDSVLQHLPAVPETTKKFLCRATTKKFLCHAAAAASPPRRCGSVPSEETLLVPGHVSSSAPSVSSGSGRIPTDIDSDTTKKLLRRAAAAASPPSACGSVPNVETILPGYVSSSAPSVSSDSGWIPTGSDIDAASPIDADADEDIRDEVLHGGISRRATAVVPEGDAGSTITVSGVGALEPACVSVAISSAAAAAESSGMAFSEFRAREPKALPDEAISLLFRHFSIRDIFRLGYLFSRRWLEIWQGIPLVMHDVQLAGSNDTEIMLTGQRFTMNLAKKISKILDLHPGPVEVFRVDSSSWQEGNNLQWRVWIHKLISKNTEEIIICGRWPRSLMDSLPNNIAHCRSLRRIYLCFFSIPRITDKLSFSNLKELGLFHCMFDNADLDSILHNCKLLKLNLGYVKLGILRIGLETLRNLRIWNCNIDILCLSGTPNLVFFLQEPSLRLDHRSHLQLRGIPELRVINTIFLNQQTVELCGYRIKADMLDYPLCWNVIRLELAVRFSSETELSLIPALLNCFPKLQNLRISRLDSDQSYAGLPIDWHRILSKVLCIKTSLIKFALCFCRGDDAENDLANAILACAKNLKDFQFELHPAYRVEST